MINCHRDKEENGQQRGLPMPTLFFLCPSLGPLNAAQLSVLK